MFPFSIHENIKQPGRVCEAYDKTAVQPRLKIVNSINQIMIIHTAPLLGTILV